MAVAAALVHLVLRGRDIGLPRSTLPVRYSFPLLLCIIHGYPAYVRVHLLLPPLPTVSPLVPSLPSSSLVALPSCTGSPSFPHSISIVPVPSTLLLLATSVPIFPIRLSFYIYIYIVYIKVTYVHLPPSISFLFPTSVPPRLPKRRRKARVSRFVIARTHLSRLRFPRATMLQKERMRERERVKGEYSWRIIIN